MHANHASNIYRVDEVLKTWGWHKTEDKSSAAFTLKWSESKQSIDYLTFREGKRQCQRLAPPLCSSLPIVIGDQLVNHFPNISLLTTKIGLLESLRYSRSRLFTTLR